MNILNLLKFKKNKSNTPKDNTNPQKEVTPEDLMKESLTYLPNNLEEIPCPIQIKEYQICVCTHCKHRDKCPAEKMCRDNGCINSFIAGCQGYTNEDDTNAEEKRKIFKSGYTYQSGVLHFRGKTDKAI